jgi:hypothetical protein
MGVICIPLHEMCRLKVLKQIRITEAVENVGERKKEEWSYELEPQRENSSYRRKDYRICSIISMDLLMPGSICVDRIQR